jgi:hypothetical protein
MTVIPVQLKVPSIYLSVLLATLWCLCATAAQDPPIPESCKETLDLRLAKDSYAGREELFNRWKHKYPELRSIWSIVNVNTLLDTYRSFEQGVAQEQYRSLPNLVTEFKRKYQDPTLFTGDYRSPMEKYDSLDEIQYLKRRISYETCSQVALDYFRNRKDMIGLSRAQIARLFTDMDCLLEPPVEFRPGMSEELYNNDINSHFSQREGLLKLKQEMQARLGELELNRWKERIEAAIAAGQSPDVLGSARDIIADTRTKVDVAKVMETATNLLNAASQAQQKRQLQNNAKDAALKQLFELQPKTTAARQRSTAPNRADSEIASAISQSAKPSTVQAASSAPAPAQTDYSSSPSFLARLWENLKVWLLFFLVAAIAATTVISIINREKWGLIIYCDYTDVAMILCAPILGFIVYGFLGNVLLPPGLAMVAGWSAFGFIEWRIFQQARHANKDTRSAFCAFVAKQGVLLAWLFAVSVYMFMGIQRVKGETEADYRVRKDHEGWRHFVIMLLVTIATSLLIRRLARSRSFSSVWGYLRGEAIPVRDAGGRNASGEAEPEGADEAQGGKNSDDDQSQAETDNTTEEDEASDNESADSSSGAEEEEGFKEAQKAPSPWEILGVKPGASEEEIRKAYHARMQEYHPDRVAYLGPELRTLAEEKSKAINEAYSILMGKEDRRTTSAAK